MEDKKLEEKKNKFKISYVVLLLLAVLLICLLFVDTNNPGKKIEWTDAYSLAQGTYDDPTTKDEVESLQMAQFYYSDGNFYILVKDSTNAKNFPRYSDYYFEYDNVSLTKVLEWIQPKIESGDIVGATVNVRQSVFLSYLPSIIFFVIAAFIMYFMFKSITGSNKSAMSFGKNRGKAVTMSKVRFSDIAGADEEKQELEEIVEFLKNPKKFTSLGARIPKGVLLVGPPGTGKTLLAKAVAGESNVPFISISGSDFVEMFVGVGASRVRDLFNQAKSIKPCIVFIDEIDAVGRQRGAGLGGGNDEREQTLNQLLVEMDGFEANEGIIVLAATNRSDVLDPALMRPGRFDRQIYVHVPDVKGREGILKIHARNKPLDESVNFTTLARLTTGFTGADIENMLNESAILAAREGKPKITMKDITEGINKVLLGPQKKSRLITPDDKKITAYHESGHALLGKLLKHCEEVQEVSIIPRGMAGGYTLSRQENDNTYRSYNKLMDDIAMTMGGRIAEELIFKDVTTGASSDIQHATKVAHNMVFDWGMSKKLGFMSLSSQGEVFIGRDYQTRNDFSEKTASEADEEVKQILNYNYKRAKELLANNINLLHEMAELLLEKETIYKDEVDMLMAGKSKEEIIAEMDRKEKEQAEKERAIHEKNKKEQKLAELKRKKEEGNKLKQAGVISATEYETIVKEVEEFEKSIGEKEIKSEPEKKEVKEPKTKTEEKSETPKKRVRKPREDKKEDEDNNG